MLCRSEARELRAWNDLLIGAIRFFGGVLVWALALEPALGGLEAEPVVSLVEAFSSRPFDSRESNTG